MNFSSVPEHEWLISAHINGQRREALLSGTSYKEIVTNISNSAESFSFLRESSKELKGYKRAVIRLTTKPEFVDLFHNSNSGYRAQYYVSPARGDKANQYALEKIVPRILKELAKKKNFEWWQKSLLGDDSKIWIKQSQTWLPRPFKNGGRIKYRHLEVKRWLERALSYDEKERNRARVSKLMPDNETGLIIKGTWLDSYGNPIAKNDNPKSLEERACHIHWAGFT